MKEIKEEEVFEVTVTSLKSEFLLWLLLPWFQRAHPYAEG